MKGTGKLRVLSSELSVFESDIQILSPNASHVYFSLLEKMFVFEQSMKRRIQKSQLKYIQDRQMHLDVLLSAESRGIGDSLFRKAPSFPKVLANRFSYRGPLLHLEDRDITEILKLSYLSPYYRPFAVAGALKILSLIFLVESSLKLVNLGDEKLILYRVVNSHGFKNYIQSSFLKRPEIPFDIASFVVVGIDVRPLIVKYETIGIGLNFATLGGVLELLGLVSAYLGLNSVILFGARELKFWSIKDRMHVIIPAALRVGRRP